MSNRTRQKAKRSGYLANTFPGTLMDMEAVKKTEIFCSTRLSKVELQARATLAVPEAQAQSRALEHHNNHGNRPKNTHSK